MDYASEFANSEEIKMHMGIKYKTDSKNQYVKFLNVCLNWLQNCNSMKLEETFIFDNQNVFKDLKLNS